MRKLTMIAIGATSAAAALAVASVALFAGSPRAVAPGKPPTTTEAEMVTLNLYASGATTIRYTCGEPDLCEVSTSPADLWSKKITVPPGTEVKVEARSSSMVPARCSIADEKDQRVVYRDPETGNCLYVAIP
jgi:hypothetical protein